MWDKSGKIHWYQELEIPTKVGSYCVGQLPNLPCFGVSFSLHDDYIIEAVSAIEGPSVEKCDDTISVFEDQRQKSNYDLYQQ
jgi:hypothetical protein